MPRRLAGLLGLALLAQACALAPRTERPIDRIDHVIVIYEENWSFDGLFGKFPGANGLANSAETVSQVDKAGRPYATLPPSLDNRKAPTVPDPRIPADLPVAPFDLGRYIPADQTSGNPLHRFYQQIYQIKYDTTSILKFIEARWGLRPLGTRDAAANDLTGAFAR